MFQMSFFSVGSLDGDGGCYEDSQQGDEEAVQEHQHRQDRGTLSPVPLDSIPSPPCFRVDLHL